MKERLKICWVEVEEEGFRFKYFYPKSIEFNSTDLNEIKLLGGRICKILERFVHLLEEKIPFASFYANGEIELDIDSVITKNESTDEKQLLGDLSAKILKIIVKYLD
jgi:hypothetical protein